MERLGKALISPVELECTAKLIPAPAVTSEKTVCTRHTHTNTHTEGLQGA